nr:MAG TPA: hypothetical protein [Caudoviricetes sp.]
MFSCMGKISAGWWHTELCEVLYWEGYLTARWHGCFGN